MATNPSGFGNVLQLEKYWDNRLQILPLSTEKLCQKTIPLRKTPDILLFWLALGTFREREEISLRSPINIQIRSFVTIF